MRVVLIFREGGAKSPCTWCTLDGIYILRNEVKKRIENESDNYKKSINKKLPPSSYIHDMLPSLFSYKVRIYNAGSANFVAIEDAAGTKILFDCGAEIPQTEYSFNPSMRMDRKRIVAKIKENLIEVLKTIKPDILIISHWHSDHYSILGELIYERPLSKTWRDIWNEAENIAINKLCDDSETTICKKARELANKYNIKWDYDKEFDNVLNNLKYIIIPCDPVEVDKFLCNKVDNQGEKAAIQDYIYSLLINTDAKVIDLSQIENFENLLSNIGLYRMKLYKGENKGMPYNNPSDPGAGWFGWIGYKRDIDDQGILLYIGDEYNNILLPGDCSYYSWPKNSKLCLNKINHLLAPHHGGNIIVQKMPEVTYDEKHLYISSGYKYMLKTMDNLHWNIEKEKKYKTRHGAYLEENGFKCGPNSDVHVHHTNDLHPSSNLVDEDYYEIEIH